MNGSRSPVIRFGNGETKRFGVEGATRAGAGAIEVGGAASTTRLFEALLFPVSFVEAMMELLRRLAGLAGGGGRDFVVGEVESVSYLDTRLSMAICRPADCGLGSCSVGWEGSGVDGMMGEGMGVAAFGVGSSTSASISVELFATTGGRAGDGGVEGRRILDRGAKSSSLDSSTSSLSTIGTHASSSLVTTTGAIVSASSSGSSAGYRTAASNRAITGFEFEAKLVVRGAVFGVEGRNGPVELANVNSLGPPTKESRFVRFVAADFDGRGAEGRGSSPSRSRGFGIVTASLGGRDGGIGEEEGFQVDMR